PESALCFALGKGPMLAADAGTAMPGRRRSGLRRFFVILGLAVVLFAGGFLWFVSRLSVAESAVTRNADGIVALTGSAFRIADALDLLAAGRGKRVLITGVNPVTRAAEISRLMPEHQRLFTCCVDLDRFALNTVGNAVET